MINATGLKSFLNNRDKIEFATKQQPVGDPTFRKDRNHPAVPQHLPPWIEKQFIFRVTGLFLTELDRFAFSVGTS